jgi:predicted histone-like DNA-binding protein
MPITYKLTQDKRDGSKTEGQWYGRRVNTGTLDIDALAQMIQDNVSVKKSDVKAVVEELIYVMKVQMQNGHTCKLDGLGSFYISMKCGYAPLEDIKRDGISPYIQGFKTNFREYVKNGVYPFRDGNTVRERVSYQSPLNPEEEEDDGEGDGD